MKKISEGVYEDVKRSDILKIEMFVEDNDGYLSFFSNLGNIAYWEKNDDSFFNCNSGRDYLAHRHNVIKHIIGRTVGEAIDWIKTKSS